MDWWTSWADSWEAQGYIIAGLLNQLHHSIGEEGFCQVLDIKNGLEFSFDISKVDVQKHCYMKSFTTAQISVSQTEEHFSALNKAYKYFNQTLINNQLPWCIHNFSWKKKT